jgi:hypothetical protein
MVALLGFGALAVDVGAMYSEKTQLQNGADSAALAIAQACQKVASSAPCAANQKLQAAPFANGNALDGSSNVVSATVSSTSATGTVDVTTETPAGAGGEHFSLYLARVLGINSVDIRASAQAKWLNPTKGLSILPLVFAPCEFIDDGHPHKILIQGGGLDCNGRNPSNQAYQGGFAWLKPNGTQPCQVIAEIGVYSAGSTGAAVPNGCLDLFTPSINPGLAGSTVALPVYSSTNGLTGSNAKYMISKWAGFKILAWNLTGQAKYDPTNVFQGSEKGIYGTFVGYSADPGLFTGSSSTSTGNVFVIELTN